MKLIAEIFNEDCEVITESNENGKKSHYISGIFMQADLKNRNGRIYPSSVLEKEMNRYNKDFIQTKRALGELGHPSGPQINGDRVSHLITDIKQDGSNFIGKAKILSTPMGNIVKTFIDEGVKIGVSTRGLGSVKQTGNGIMEVQNDFHLATVDIVTDPSGPNCFVNGIMENTEYYFDIATSTWQPNINVDINDEAARTRDNALFEAAMLKLEQLEEQIKEMKNEYKTTNSKKQIDESKALKIFEKYMSALNHK